MIEKIKKLALILVLVALTYSEAAPQKNNTKDVCKEEPFWKPENDCLWDSIAWTFVADTNECKLFAANGCENNGNAFDSKEECENQCKKLVAPPEEGTKKDVCKEDPFWGPETDCLMGFLSWSYVPASNKCREFMAGCETNGNAFQTIEECENQCKRLVVPPEKETKKDVCKEEAFWDPEVPCVWHFPAWSYFADTDECRPFDVNACDDNGNAFRTKEKCEKQCKKFVAPPKKESGKDVCKEKPFWVPEVKCGNSFKAWSYDVDTNRCKSFKADPCKINGNAFNTRDECNHRCRLVDPPKKEIDVCKEEPFWLPEFRCYVIHDVWSYVADTNECRPFDADACEKNGNAFYSKDECENQCRQLVAPPEFFV